MISWGVLLTGVQNIHAVALAPWLFLPAVAIVVTVLAFYFVGDGLRDAADPMRSNRTQCSCDLAANDQDVIVRTGS